MSRIGRISLASIYLLFYYFVAEMSTIARRGIHFMQRLNSASVSAALLENGQNRVIDASLTLIRERAKLKASHDLVFVLLDRIFCFSVVVPYESVILYFIWRILIISFV